MLICVFLLLSGCQKTLTLGEEIESEFIQTVKIEFLHEDKGDRILTTTQAREDIESLLKILLAAPVTSAPEVAWYSPPYSATHRIDLSGGGDSTQLYYDMGTGILARPIYKEGKTADDPPLLSYQFYKPDEIDPLIAEQKEFAVIPFTPEGSTPKHMDVYLRASIDETALKVEGETLNYDMAAPPTYEETESIYRVLSDGDMEGVSVPKGYYLIIVGMGVKETSGYSIDIDRIEVNESYTKVYVNEESPVTGEPVEMTPSSPMDAALVEQQLLSTKKIVVFLDANDTILGLQQLDS